MKKDLSSITRKARCSATLLITSGKQMSNSCAPCFNRFYFAFIPSLIEPTKN